MRLPSPRPSRWALALACAALPCLAAGCSTHGKVRGKVTMSDGQPLPGGTISFIPVGGKGNVASAWISPDGTYELDAPVGECAVTIDNRNVGKKPAAPVGAGGGGDAPPPPEKAAGGPKVPQMKGPRGYGVSPPPGTATGPPGLAGPPGMKGGPAQDKGHEIEDRMKQAGQAPVAASGEVQPGTPKPINPKYYTPEGSGLTFKVKGGEQSFDIKLDP